MFTHVRTNLHASSFRQCQVCEVSRMFIGGSYSPLFMTLRCLWGREREREEMGKMQWGCVLYIQCIASTIVWVSPDMAHISKLRGGC